MKFFNVNHPMFRPLWARVLVVAICFGWGTVEFVSASRPWAAIFYLAGIYLVWALFFNFSLDAEDEKDGAPRE